MAEAERMHEHEEIAKLKQRNIANQRLGSSAIYQMSSTPAKRLAEGGSKSGFLTGEFKHLVDLVAARVECFTDAFACLEL